MANVNSVCPIANEDTNALPVRSLESAIAFYDDVLGFSTVRRDASSAVLARDHVQIGIVLREGHDPARAGSIAFAVDDLEAMRYEIEGSGGSPGELGFDEWGGKRYRTFFLHEMENGYCFCFYCAVP
ncbi:MAG: VOC family protein [Verrucomicrobiota bacterium]